jgi:hypothetical protein
VTASLADRLAYVTLALEGERWNTLPGALSKYAPSGEKYVTPIGFLAALDAAITDIRTRTPEKANEAPSDA